MPSAWSLLPAAALSPVTITAASWLVPLPSLGLLTLTGPDSLKFLQGQTTTDFREVEKGRVLPGAVCSLKGRVLFSFLAVPAGNDVALVLPDDQVEAAHAHLGKYAVFSKTTLQDARSAYALLGLMGPDAAALLAPLELAPPAAGGSSRNAAGLWAIRPFAEERYLVALPAAELAPHWERLRHRAPVAGEEAWWAADIRAGFATVSAAARDRFQPQELNYPALEGVSYNKGCYTGQEVVARLYFRGKLKQRLYRLAATGTAMAGAGIVHAGGTPVGEVVMAAREGPGRLALLAVVRNAAVREGGLTLGADGPTLQVQPLPYALPAEKEE